jgi:hypothetical protein
VCELRVREDEHARDAGRAGGAEDPELVEVRRAGVRLVEERLQIGVAQPLVRDDTVEVLHQKRLREGRKRIERALRCVGTQRLPVVRGVCDRVAHQLLEPLALISEHLGARPAVVRKQLARSSADLLEGVARGGNGHSVLLSSRGTATPRRNAATVSSNTAA